MMKIYQITANIDEVVHKRYGHFVLYKCRELFPHCPKALFHGEILLNKLEQLETRLLSLFPKQ